MDIAFQNVRDYFMKFNATIDDRRFTIQLFDQLTANFASDRDSCLEDLSNIAGMLVCNWEEENRTKHKLRTFQKLLRELILILPDEFWEVDWKRYIH